MSSDLLVELLQTLDGPQHRYTELDRYASGRQKLAYLSPEARIALPALNRIVSNIPGLAVTSLAERLRVTGFKGVDVWADWLANDLDQTSTVLHREALTFGDSYVICWARPDGSPLVTVESPQQVTAIRDPATREIASAVKRWRTKTETHAMVYLADRIEHWRARTAGAATSAFELVEVIEHHLETVPVVGFSNQLRILGCGHSELDDLIPLVDGLNATLAGLAVAQEFTARPRRWATGIELVEVPKLDADDNPILDGDGQPVTETVNPIPEGNRAMLSENDQAKFGQLPGADLAGYEAACRIWLQQIMAVSALPAHMVGITTENPSSSEAIRASESALTARAEQRQAIFGRSWEQVARLMVAIRDGARVDSVTVNVQWRDPSSTSVAAEADAVTKLVQAGILSKSGALRRLGYSEDEIVRESASRANEEENESAMGIFYGRQIHDAGKAAQAA
ncbi:phage portal protein [Mycobacterium intracellulare]|uniref:phage portal protein n=1 Tax=Mycobacterium intracellulare TaxID=1767 RepID=UPI001DE39491|nr:phage portal protein [Mycobacterium intracellulare]